MSAETQDLTATAPAAGPQPVATRLAEAERYALLEQIGAGAMGVVYAAYDAQLDRKVALKLLPEHQLGGDHRDRLLREARALAQLSHPNVVAVYDVGETQGRVFFAMEFVRGQTVAAWAREPRTLDEILDVFRAAARGLAAAHAAQLVHRDVKPSNVLVGDDGRVRVVDFGLAHPGRGLAAGTPEGQAAVTGFAGSPAYMAPEQLRDAVADPRSDQFALCVSLYEVLHGQRPFTGDTPEELLTAIEAGPPPLVRAVPAWVTAAIARGLAPDPAARFPDMTALAAALEPPRRARRTRWLLAGVAAALAAGGATVLATREDAGAAAPRCDLEATAFATAWDPARRAALVRKVGVDEESAAGAERLAVQLDAYASGLRQHREHACQAARVDLTWPVELEERAIRCLERRREALERTLGAVLDASAPVTVETTRAAVTGLDSIHTCVDPDYLRSATEVAVPPAQRAAIAALEADVYQLGLASTLHRNDEVARTLPVLRDRATALGHAPIEAKLLNIEGSLARERDLATAARLHIAAYAKARAARDPVTAAQAAVALVWDLGLHGEDVTRAGDWAEIAAAESASLDDRHVGIIVHYALGALADRRDDLARSIAEFERSAELAHREYGPEHHITARMNIALASMLGAAGRYSEAIPPHLAAIEVLERWEGPQSRTLISALYNLALTESSAELHTAAEQHARRALSIAERHDDPENLGTALRNLGVVLTNMGRRGDAVPLYARAAATFEGAGLSGSAASARVQRVLAATPALIASRDPAELPRARAELERSRATLASVFGPDSLEVADADAVLANLLAELGRCGDARPHLARAVASFEAAKAPADRLGLVEHVKIRCAVAP